MRLLSFIDLGALFIHQFFKLAYRFAYGHAVNNAVYFHFPHTVWTDKDGLFVIKKSVGSGNISQLFQPCYDIYVMAFYFYLEPSTLKSRLAYQDIALNYGFWLALKFC